MNHAEHNTEKTLQQAEHDLNLERQQHAATLRLLARYFERAGVLSAVGTRRNDVCRLCEKVPINADPRAFRLQCPCRLIPGQVEQNESRLRVAPAPPEVP